MPAIRGGIWPALLTPLGADGKPAFKVLEQLTDLFAQQGLGGLYVTGSTGQWPLLSLDERRQIAECVVKASAGRLPIMVHVGAASTADAADLARHAARTGADAISSVAPIYYSYSPDAVFTHYRTIGAAGGLPFFIYHFSPVNQLTLDPRDYAERILKLPNIAGMKITDRDLYVFGLIQAYAGGRLQLFSGADELMCQAVLSGAMGAIGTFYNLWGPTCAKARAAVVSGDVQSGQQFMARFQTAIAQVLASGSIWAFLRAAMLKKYRIDVGVPRPPLGATDKPWNDADIDRLLALVDQS